MNKGRGHIRMRVGRKLRMLGALSAASIGGALFVGTGGTSSAATGTPLVFGSVQTNTGSLGLPQSGQAFDAFIANWNKHGGYKGHPIRIIGIDGALDATATANAARTLVSADNVIGMVNSYSFLDCPINNSYYASSQIADIGTGGHTSCYIPNVDFSTQKVGGSGGYSVVVKYATKTGSKNIALIYPPFNGAQNTIDAFTKQAALGHATFESIQVPLTATAADFDGALAQAKAAGADTIVNLSQASQGELLIQEGNRNGFGPADVRYFFGPTEYNPSLASAFKGTYEYLYGYAWNTNNAQVKQALQIIKSSPVKVSVIDGIAENGYQQAGEFQQVLESVKGPVTRASFLKAAEHATSIAVPLTSGFRINMVHPQGDRVGGVIVKDSKGGFKAVSGFITTAL